MRYLRLFTLFAENARPAAGPDLLQRCPVCQWRPTEHERVADLVNGAGVVHVAGCVAMIAGTAVRAA